VKKLETKLQTLIKLAGEEKEEYKQSIKDLQQKNNLLNKTIEELKKDTKLQTKDQGTQTEKNFTLKNYSCQICFENRKGGIPSQLIRVKGLGGERGKKIWGGSEVHIKAFYSGAWLRFKGLLGIRITIKC
ncbi:18942_t:CDS:2, partial [Funneliformis geosporum]